METVDRFAAGFEKGADIVGPPECGAAKMSTKDSSEPEAMLDSVINMGTPGGRPSSRHT